MKQFHSVDVSLFIKEGEEHLKDLYAQMFPFPLERQLHEKKLQGFNERIITDLHVELKKQQEIKAFLKVVFEKLEEHDLRLLITQLDTMINEEGWFFMRIAVSSIDKEKYQLTEGGKCVHIKCKIAAFPSSRENLKTVMKTFLENLI